MATYVMGDVHGDIERYNAMMQLIRLKDTDKLIMIGDVVDRESYGIDILLDVMNRDNVEFIMGNHELMMIDTLAPNRTNIRKEYDWMYNWFNNGGRCTYIDFRSRPDEIKNSILEYLTDSPYERYLRVGDRDFYIVHGGPEGCDDNNKFEQLEYNLTWNRVPPDGKGFGDDNLTVIFGHTPTCIYRCNIEDGHFTIFKNSNYVNIDCGCGHNDPRSCLACIRLDDMEEFYIH